MHAPSTLAIKRLNAPPHFSAGTAKRVGRGKGKENYEKIIICCEGKHNEKQIHLFKLFIHVYTFSLN